MTNKKHFNVLISSLIAASVLYTGQVCALESIDHPANRPCIEKVKAFLEDGRVGRITDDELQKCYTNYKKSSSYDQRSFSEYSCLIGVNASIELMREQMGVKRDSAQSGKVLASNRRQNKGNASGKGIEIEAFELMRLYENNQLKADDMFKDKLVTIIGEVDRVRRDAGFGHIVVDLKADNVNIYDIAANVKRSFEKEALSLKKGDRVKIKGIVIGVAEYGAGVDVDEASIALN